MPKADQDEEQAGAPGDIRRTRRVWRTSLVADTDVAIGRLLGRDLRPEGFGVDVEYTAQAVLDRVAGDCPDTVILGSDLPDMTALDLVGRLNATPGPPLLVLVEARGANIVQVLDAGADDCMCKPILVGELAARLRKLVRRHLQDQGMPTVIRTATLELDCVLWRARVRGVAVRLSVKEQAALRMLVEDIGNVVSNRDLLARLWGSPNLAPRGRIGAVIHTLRRKLDLAFEGAHGLLAVPQVGYRLVVSGPIAQVEGQQRK
ncbi:response regulator transcription factor [Acidisphaera sp. L21]|uniref:response regulator transcription factor n=1 Tax=Acidisphaera sp. L21 TaxID=1641851 RepID=UPI00131D0985|nr:response regulator transcription factor [Acidisphaera sp. L21]